MPPKLALTVRPRPNARPESLWCFLASGNNSSQRQGEEMIEAAPEGWQSLVSVTNGAWLAHVKLLAFDAGESPVLEVEAITSGSHPNAKLLGQLEPLGHQLLTWTPDQCPNSGPGRHGTQYSDGIEDLYRITVENALRHTWPWIGYRPSVRIVGAGSTLETAEAAVAMSAAALAIAIHSEDFGAVDVEAIRGILGGHPWEPVARPNG